MQDTAFRLISNERGKEKNTEHPRVKTLFTGESISFYVKKGFTTLPRKTGHPDRARARLQDAEKS